MYADILIAQIYSSSLLKFLVQENVQKNHSTLSLCRVKHQFFSLPNLFWITASDGFVSWNYNLFNFQMFIWSETYIEISVNECSEISGHKNNFFLPAPKKKKTPSNPTRSMCAKFTWVNWANTEKYLCVSYLNSL